MENVENIVLESAKAIIKEKELNVELDLDVIMSDGTGFDSLGFVTFVLELEDKISFDLDPILPDIRASKRLRDVVDLINSLG